MTSTQFFLGRPGARFTKNLTPDLWQRSSYAGLTPSLWIASD